MSKNKMAMLTADKALRIVEVEDIKFDSSYQRGETSNIKKIMSSFDKNAFGVPLVAQREDGTLWGVDGPQRLTAVTKMGWKTVRVEVFVSKGPEHEAEVFRLVNANRVKLSAGELFRAKLTEGDKAAWDIKKAVEDAGFSLLLGRGRTNGQRLWKEIAAIQVLEYIYKTSKDSERAIDIIKRILTVSGESWPEDRLVTNNLILGGLYTFYQQRGDDMVDDERLIDRLRTTQPTKIIYSAGLGIGSRQVQIALIIDKMYNKRKAKK